MTPTPTPPPPPPGRGRPRVAGQRRLARRPQVGEVVGEIALDQPAAPPVDDSGEPSVEPASGIPEVAAGPAGPAARAGSAGQDRPWLVPAALGAAVALVATLAGVLFATHHAGERRLAVADARTAARLAAAQGLTAVLSYDYTTFDADVARGKRYLTPTFAAQYVKEQNKAVKETAIKAHAKVSADVSAVGVIEASPHEVRLLAFATQTSTTKDRPTPRVDRARILVVMDKIGGHWLIASIKPI